MNFNIKYSIKGKIFLAFFLMLLVVAVIGVVISFMTQQALQESVGKTSVFVAEDIIQDIDHEIFSRIREVERFSQSSLVQEMISSSNASFEELDDPTSFLQQEDTAWRAVPDGETSPLIDRHINNLLSDELRRFFTDFGRVRYGDIGYAEVFITNRYGANVAQTGRTSDYYQADEAWWQEAVEDGVLVNTFEYDESARVWGVPLTVPVRDGDGVIIGVVKAVIPTSVIIQGIEIADTTYETTNIMLVTHDGKVIYESGVFRFLEDISSHDVFQATSQESGFFVGERADTERLFSYALSDGFGSYPGQGWMLFITHELDEVFGPVYAMRWLFAGIIFISFIVMTLVAYALSRAISSPIISLTETMRRVSVGDLNARSHVATGDEIGAMARTFNIMIGKLQRIDEAKQQFITTASHKLRTPLTSLRLFIETMQKGTTRSVKKQREQLANMYTVTKHMIGLSNDLLMVSRIESDGITLQPQSVDLALLMDEVFDHIRQQFPLLKKKAITFAAVPSSLSSMTTDPALLREVLIRILNNAVRYANEKDPKIAIDALPIEEGYRITITDNGIGITDEERGRLFEKFFRSDRAVARDTEGTGLGLYIVMSLLKILGGGVSITDREGGGTVVTITLVDKEMKKTALEKMV